MSGGDHILLAHGGGGQLTAELIQQVILPALGPACPQQPARLTDSAQVDLAGGPVVFTTDSGPSAWRWCWKRAWKSSC